jgi:hypothetical protein
MWYDVVMILQLFDDVAVDNWWMMRKGRYYFWFLPPFLVFSFIAMVDIHSVAASSHPSHRERESERDGHDE